MMNAAEALLPSVRVAVLDLLLSNPTRRYYVRELVTRLKVGHGSIQHEVALLHDCGLLVREAAGRRVYYGANVRHPAYSSLHAFLSTTVGFVGQLRDALTPVASDIQAAFVFGSMASGSATDESDVDLLVVGEVPFGDVVARLRHAEERLDREVNASVMPAAELRERLKARSPFIERVMAGPKVFVIGGDNELAELAG